MRTFVIARKDGKFFLAESLRRHNDHVRVIPEKNRWLPNGYTEVDIPYEDIVAELGSDPAIGKAYGQDVEPWRKTIESKWGSIHFFKKYSKSDMITIKKAMDDVYGRLGDNTSFLPIDVEFRQFRGKMAGYYRRNTKKSDVMALMPVDDDGIDFSTLVDIMLHESAHGIWYNLVSDYMRAQWIEAYEDYLKVNEYSMKDLDGMYTTLVQYETIQDCFNDLDDTERDFLRSCLRSMGLSRKLRRQNIDMLLRAGKLSKKYWPQYPLSLPNNQQIVLTEYANKNVEEFFAEAFRMYLNDEEWVGNKRLKKLVRATMISASSE